MRLSTFTDYSLRVLMYLAVQPDRRATIAEIATVFGVSEHHLTKVVHFLGQQGWLATLRGKGGGVSLARTPADIGVGSVVRQTEGPDVLAECFEETGGACAIAPVCRLRGVLDDAVKAFYAVLDGHTLADLVSNRQTLGRVLFLDRAAGEKRRA